MNRALWSGLRGASVALVCLATVGAHAEVKLKKSALTSIAGMSSIDGAPDDDDPGVGGGIDSATYFRNRMLPKLDDCTNSIRNVYDKWGSTLGLASVRREAVPGSLVIHMTNNDLNGLFELTYRVDAKRERARVTVYFYSADGARHEPSGIAVMLQRYQIAALQDDLEKALLCGSL
jgi:hypothetical protein